MWDHESKELAREVVRYRLTEDGRALGYLDVVERWRTAEFAGWFSKLLAASPFTAFFWECRPVTAVDAADPFEFVLLRARSLEGALPNVLAFEEYFRHSGTASVKVFPNLGRDAMLVVPAPNVPDGYPHLASFVRTAPETQKIALWDAVSRELRSRLGANPVWLSTCGLGVFWLHVRLDEYPKYYQFREYRITHRTFS